MKNRSLLISLFNRIVLLIAFGFFAKQLFINSFIEDYFSASQSFSGSPSHQLQHRSARSEKEVDAPGTMATNQEKLVAEIDLLDFKLMPFLGSDENLSDDDLKKLNRIFTDLEKIKNVAQKKHVTGLLSDRIEKLEKQIIICKQTTNSDRKK